MRLIEIKKNISIFSPIYWFCFSKAEILSINSETLTTRGAAMILV